MVTLHDCLSAFFSTDELKGDNMYSCEKCNKLRNGIKFSKVSTIFIMFDLASLSCKLENMIFTDFFRSFKKCILYAIFSHSP